MRDFHRSLFEEKDYKSRQYSMVVISFRNATMGDFQAIFLLLKQLWPDEELSRERTRAIFEDALKNRGGVQLVIRNREIIVGYASVTFRQDIQAQGRVAYLSEFVVDEVYRNRGFGESLLREISRQSKAAGAKELQLSSTFRREDVHAFYEKRGFHKTAYFFWKEL